MALALKNLLTPALTGHCTNGILIQRSVPPGVDAASAPRIQQMKGKRKGSFSPQFSKLLPYNAGKRCGPGNMAIANQDLIYPKFPDYAKSQEIVWKQTDEFSNVVLRMGAFHTAMTFIAVLGKRFGDTGLSDLFIEAGIIASGSVSGVLEGRQYNRAMRAHKIVMEAIHRIRLKSFWEWLYENEKEEYQAAAGELDKVCIQPSAELFNEMLATFESRTLLELCDDLSNQPNEASCILRFLHRFSLLAAAIHKSNTRRELEPAHLLRP